MIAPARIIAVLAVALLAGCASAAEQQGTPSTTKSPWLPTASTSTVPTSTAPTSTVPTTTVPTTTSLSEQEAMSIWVQENDFVLLVTKLETALGLLGTGGGPAEINTACSEIRAAATALKAVPPSPRADFDRVFYAATDRYVTASTDCMDGLALDDPVRFRAAIDGMAEGSRLLGEATALVQ